MVCHDVFVGATRRVAPTEVWLSTSWCIEMHPTIKLDESGDYNFYCSCPIYGASRDR